jgi:hypothetical protein
MSGAIFLIQDNGQLMEMNEEGYITEDVLQTLLAKYPNLLAGDQMNNEAPRRWLLVSREASLPSEEGGAGRWAVDHLFLDQDAIPTLVEVKRSTDTRIRREVVGQMLDYAANAVVYWPAEKIRAQFEATYQVQGLEPEQIITDFLDPETNPEDFWQRMKTNLQAGKIRLVFVADKIPSELQRIVEFLNGQMDPAEVLALEVKQYMGKGLKTLVPKIIGLTAAVEQKKSAKSRETRQWDEPSFLEELQLRGKPEDVNMARKILEWVKTQTLNLGWGKGKVSGSFRPRFDINGITYYFITGWTTSEGLVIELRNLKEIQPFNEEQKVLDLINRLKTVPGFFLPPGGNPRLRWSSLKDDIISNYLLETLDWVIQEIKTASKD